MGFIDWIKNRGASKQQTVTPKPQTQENAKQAYARIDAQERAAFPSVSKMPEAVKGAANDIGANLQKYGDKVLENNPGFQMKDVESASSPQPMRQNQMRQHVHAEALSPTSGQSGQEHHHTGAPASEKAAPEEPKPEAPKPAQPTMPRRPPSWER